VVEVELVDVELLVLELVTEVEPWPEGCPATLPPLPRPDPWCRSGCTAPVA